jgi:hypothetical protein
MSIPSIVSVCGNLKASAKTLENMAFNLPDQEWHDQIVSDFQEAERAMSAFRQRFTRKESSNV